MHLFKQQNHNKNIPVTPICKLFIAYLKPPAAFHFTVKNFTAVTCVHKRKKNRFRCSVDFIHFLLSSYGGGRDKRVCPLEIAIKSTLKKKITTGTL